MTDILGNEAIDMTVKGHIKPRINENHPVKEKPQHHLASPGLPTIPHRLAHCIWRFGIHGNGRFPSLKHDYLRTGEFRGSQ